MKDTNEPQVVQKKQDFMPETCIWDVLRSLWVQVQTQARHKTGPLLLVREAKMYKDTMAEQNEDVITSKRQETNWGQGRNTWKQGTLDKLMIEKR